MQRIEAINPETTTGTIKALLNDVLKADGTISSMVLTMANSPAVLEGFLRFSDALSGGTLSARLRELSPIFIRRFEGRSRAAICLPRCDHPW